jgi:hypothetical protein
MEGRWAYQLLKSKSFPVKCLRNWFTCKYPFFAGGIRLRNLNIRPICPSPCSTGIWPTWLHSTCPAVRTIHLTHPNCNDKRVGTCTTSIIALRNCNGRPRQLFRSGWVVLWIRAPSSHCKGPSQLLSSGHRREVLIFSSSIIHSISNSTVIAVWDSSLQEVEAGMSKAPATYNC